MILLRNLLKKKWVNTENELPLTKSDNPSELIILSRREEAIIGTHVVDYTSTTDKIEIRHEAFSREGFAKEQLQQPTGFMIRKVFEFGDIVGELE